MDRKRIRMKIWSPLLRRLLFYHHTFFLLLFATFLRSAIGHVLLTYPEARYPPLDFLDSERTIGPCGLPRSTRSQVTSFKAGELYNITWRMQFPLKGGFRLSLLDQFGFTIISRLSANKDAQKSDGNGTEFVDGLIDDQTTESFPVRFTSECQNCTLLLERQALEWGNESYLLRSCAEVRVIEKLEEQCSGGGVRSAKEGQCTCERNRSGPECQYQDDCSDDSDCGTEGKCLQDSIFPNQRSCFCSYGFLGVNCERRSDPDPDDQQCFAHNGLRVKADADGVFLYGLFNATCYNRSTLNEQTGDMIYWRVLGTYLEVILDFESQSWVSLGWRPLNIPNICRLSPLLFSPNSGARPRGGNDGGADDSGGMKTNGYSKSALNAPLHPMDCTDLVMASVRDGNWLHLEDLYTRDRSTPLRDDWLDGEQSLSAAYGLERDGRTVVMFRRMITEIEPTDHPLGPGRVHVIYAKGQTHRNTSTIAKFYKDDQWRYHGESEANRGTHQLEFVSAEQMRRFKGPLIHLHTVTGQPPTNSTSTSRSGSSINETSLSTSASSTSPTTIFSIPAPSSPATFPSSSATYPLTSESISTSATSSFSSPAPSSTATFSSSSTTYPSTSEITSTSAKVTILPTEIHVENSSPIISTQSTTTSESLDSEDLSVKSMETSKNSAENALEGALKLANFEERTTAPESDKTMMPNRFHFEETSRENNVDKWHQKPSLSGADGQAESDFLAMDGEVESGSIRTSCAYLLWITTLSALLLIDQTS